MNVSRSIGNRVRAVLRQRLCLCVGIALTEAACWGAEATGTPGAESLDSICDGMLRTLLAGVNVPAGKRLTVAVGNIPCNNVGTEGISTFSRLLQDAVEGAVGRAPQAELITRSRLDELMEEKNFQTLDLLDPGTAVENVNVKGVEAIIRGHYYYNFPVSTVKLQLVSLTGGNATVVSANVPVSVAGTGQLLPPAEVKKIEQNLLPPNVSQTEANAESVQTLIAALPNREIATEIWVKGGRTDFAADDKVTFTVRVGRGCHVAVFCHQIDGSTVLLFPNQYHSDCFMPADRAVAIPGEDRDTFYIVAMPPFGGDIVQVVACSSKARLQSLIQERQALGTQFYTLSRDLLTRGLGVVGMGQAAGPADEGIEAGQVKWGEAHVVIHTYPR